MKNIFTLAEVFPPRRKVERIGEGIKEAKHSENISFAQQTEKDFSPASFHFLRKRAFTLAEVLITLGIIGVVAAMTLPSIINKYKRIEAKTRLKRAYSIISQAFTASIAKYGDVDDWEEWDNAEEILKKYIAPEIKNAKVYSSNVSNYWKTMCYDGLNEYFSSSDKDHFGMYTWMDKVYISNPFYSDKTASVKLYDGSCVGLNPSSTSISSQDKNIFIDINGGSRGPNIAGYDLFFFKVEKNRIVPYGYDWENSQLSDSSIQNSCHPEARRGGYVCAAYIMSKGWKITYW